MATLKTPKQNPRLSTTKVVSGTVLELHLEVGNPHSIEAGDSKYLFFESEVELPKDLYYIVTREGLPNTLLVGQLDIRSGFSSGIEITNIGPISERVNFLNVVAVEPVMFRGLPQEQKPEPVKTVVAGKKPKKK